jgi:TldD protein
VAETELFLEGRGTWTLRATERGVSGWRGRDCGLGWTARGGDGAEYRWEPFEAGRRPDLPAEAVAPAQWAAECGSVRCEDEPWTAALVALCDRARAEGARGAAATLSGDTRRKYVLGERAVSDERVHVRLALRITGPERTTILARLYPGPAEFLADGPALERAIAETVGDLGRRRVACPDAALPVVLAAGAPAHFFHEVYGHPMEGDVVARGGSYLAALRGRPIAEELLTVVDDPLRPGAPAGQAVDDEGQPARPVTLLDRGRVGEPLLHRASAARLGLPGNGHARRLSFRYGTLPRLTHVEVAGHAGRAADLVAPIGHGVLVRSLRLRHLNALTGEFSCYLDDAREIRTGEVGPPLEPGLLVGNGLSAAAAVDAVAAGAEGEPWGISGCGKLDQGPVTVSFQQPAVRLTSARVLPWR